MKVAHFVKMQVCRIEGFAKKLDIHSQFFKKGGTSAECSTY